MNVLVLAAHPDDESIGMAGTIAALTDAGHAVYVATFTDGVGARGEGEAEANRRRRCFRAACDVLGKADMLWPNRKWPDQGLSDRHLREMRLYIERCIELMRPTVVYAHSPHDLNSDHRAVYEAALPAVRPKSGVRDVFCYQGVRMLQPFEPVAFMDITATADRKWQAIACYGDELQAELAVAKAWAVVHGYRAGMVMAEGFEVHRMIQECAAC